MSSGVAATAMCSSRVWYAELREMRQDLLQKRGIEYQSYCCLPCPCDCLAAYTSSRAEHALYVRANGPIDAALGATTNGGSLE